jgi:hypothetical protein
MQNVELYANVITGVIMDLQDPDNTKPAHKLRKKIFKDTMSYLP